MKNTILLVRNVRAKDFGGAETYQLQLAKILKKEKLRPVIITSSRGLRSTAKQQKLKVTRGLHFPLQNWSSWRNLLLPLYFLWQITLCIWYLTLVVRFRPQVLHLQSRDDYIAGTIIGKITHTSVIWTDHADFCAFIWQNLNVKYKNPIGKCIYRLSHIPYKITTISKYEYTKIKQLIHPRKLPNLIVFSNGVIDSYEKYQRITPEPQSFCYIGRIVKEKGITELIEAFNRLMPHYPHAKLHLYGDGADLLQYQKNKNSQVIFHGHTNKPLDALADCEIFILPSYKEGLSLALLDAAMMERSIIATNVGGTNEVVIDHQTGLLVDAKSSDELYRAMCELLDNPKLRKYLATNARERYLKHFDFSTLVSQQLFLIYYNQDE